MFWISKMLFTWVLWVSTGLLHSSIVILSRLTTPYTIQWCFNNYIYSFSLLNISICCQIITVSSCSLQCVTNLLSQDLFSFREELKWLLSENHMPLVTSENVHYEQYWTEQNRINVENILNDILLVYIIFDIFRSSFVLSHLLISSLLKHWCYSLY